MIGSQGFIRVRSNEVRLEMLNIIDAKGLERKVLCNIMNV